jgi:hypothetical protein
MTNVKRLDSPLEARLRERIINDLADKMAATFHASDTRSRISKLLKDGAPPLYTMEDHDLLDKLAGFQLAAATKYYSLPTLPAGMGITTLDYCAFRDELIDKYFAEVMSNGPKAAA